jgi:hypothetical protein
LGICAPVRSACTVAMASTAPAAPNRCPIMDFVELMCSPPSPSASVIALQHGHSRACTEAGRLPTGVQLFTGKGFI